MLRAALPCLVLAISLTHARMQLRYNACLPYGPETRSFVLTDSDHDGLGEFCYRAWSDMFHPFWAIAEYRPVDRYEIVQADTGIYPYPSSLLLGNFVPHDVADLDRDGKTELVGEVFSYDTITPAPRKDVCTVESRDSLSLPDTLTWHYADTYDPNGIGNRHVTDLDQDSVLEITTTWDPAAIAIFENVGDDQDSLVFYHSSPYYYAKPRTWGDFDQNGKMELVADAYGAEHIFECTGDNQYAEVCSLGPVRTNQNDWFTGRDADRNGKPEFFVVYGDGWNKVWLYMFEAVAEHQYAFYLIDSAHVSDFWSRSLCADLDGDGTEEVIWGCGQYVRIMQATAPHQFDTVCVWQSTCSRSMCAVADFNGNGYNELYAGEDERTIVGEVEAIRLLYPTRGGLRFLAGDTCWIRWMLFEPPRCDSVSLFLRTDSVVPEGQMFWDLDTITTGLSPSDTTCPWVIPDTALGAAWIVAIAYGPGWQYSASLSPFRIVPSGVAECNKPVTLGPLPEPTIVGGVLVWSATTPSLRNVRQNGDCPSGRGPVPALLDISGRKVMELAPGPNDIRHLAPGVYFVRRPETEDGRPHTAMRKIVILR
jgi:hypothetical protein